MTPARPKLLIVDDGARYAELAHHFLRDYDYATRCELEGPCWDCARRRGCTLTHAHDLGEAEDALRRHPDVDAVLLDVAFDLPEERLAPPRDARDGRDVEARRRTQGLDILHRLRRARGELPVVLMTSREELADPGQLDPFADDELVMLAGADAFDARALGLLIERVLERRRASPATGGWLWGRTLPLARVRAEAMALARTSLPMLLLGETGTGKSALAETVIHAATGRSGPFVAVDLASIPSTLVAAELFGTARGAFSGAVDRPGRLEAAHGGTLLLDEIGNLPPEVQRMLLLCLEDGRVTRLGESTPRTVDLKLVAATNADLAAGVRAGTFRGDLYARLNPAAQLRLPPLRERLADLEELLAVFVRRAFAAGANRKLLAEYADAARLSGPTRADIAFGRPPARPEAVTFVLSPPSLKALKAHAWPGNVRELALFAANATALSLVDALAAARRGSGATSAAPRIIPIPPRLVPRLLSAEATSRAPHAGAPVALALTPHRSLRDTARDLERQVYERLFHECEGSFTEMARRLLGSGSEAAARRVRLRFNQLGLRARALSRDS